MGSEQDPTGIFESLSAASFRPDGGDEVFFPLSSIKEDGGSRLAKHRRMHSRGARLDGSGMKERTWTIRSLFHNLNWEADDLGIGRMYPEQVDLLILSFEEQVTGTLWLPTRGPVRARCETYTRIDAAEMRDAAALDMIFVEDNEDDSWKSSFAAPPFATNGNAGEFGEDVEGLGESIGDLAASVEELASELEGFVNAPQDFVDEVKGTVDALKGSAERVVDAMEQASEAFLGGGLDGATAPAEAQVNVTVEEAMRIMASPARVKVLVRIVAIKEFAARAQANALRSSARSLPMTANRAVSMFELAAERGVSLTELVRMNGGLDPLLVPAGTSVVMPAGKIRTS